MDLGTQVGTWGHSEGQVIEGRAGDRIGPRRGGSASAGGTGSGLAMRGTSRSAQSTVRNLGWGERGARSHRTMGLERDRHTKGRGRHGRRGGHPAWAPWKL